MNYLMLIAINATLFLVLGGVAAPRKKNRDHP
jgi:hypothetical protein